MTTTKRIREYLREHPNARSSEVDQALGLPTGKASKALSLMLARGYVSREQVGKSITNVAVYGYSVTDKTPSKPGRKPGSRNRPKIKHEKSVTHQKTQVTPVAAGSVDDLIESMARTLVSQIVSRVRSELPIALAKIAPALPAPSSTANPIVPVQVPHANMDLVIEAPSAAVAVKPRVGVIGLLPVQAGEIVRWLGQSADLVFWDRGADKGKLRNIAETCEVVFLHTRHAGHATDQVLKAYHANIRRVTGAVSNMKVAIKSYFDEKEKAA